ncbi:hypothetical protein BDZ45DRAFT_689779 [Acephala macrosclerotiorum]|nr:hypothetical protein BDZ45DRAFT_689779 [Acephala macrosclerotiorum]
MAEMSLRKVFVEVEVVIEVMVQGQFKESLMAMYSRRGTVYMRVSSTQLRAGLSLLHLTAGSVKTKTIPLMSSPTPSEAERQFSDVLIMSAIIAKTRIPFIEEATPDPESSNTFARRKFLTSLAYLCDPGNTTAIALERASRGIVYWIASNTNSPQGWTLSFLADILLGLKTVCQGDAAILEQDFFEEAIKFDTSKLKSYIYLLQQDVDKLLKQLKRSGLAGVFRSKVEWPTDISRLTILWQDELRFLLASTQMTETRFVETLEDARHTFYLLGRTRECVKVVVATALSQLELFENLAIGYVGSPTSRRMPNQIIDL